MTKLIFSLLLFLLLPGQDSNIKHIGKWENNEDNQIGYLVMDDENYASLHIDGNVMGGKSSLMNGIEVYMLYQINYKTDPIELDFIVHRLDDDSELRRLKNIIKFQDNDNVTIALGFSGDRPENFESDNALTFTRQQ